MVALLTLATAVKYASAVPTGHHARPLAASPCAMAALGPFGLFACLPVWLGEIHAAIGAQLEVVRAAHDDRGAIAVHHIDHL